jgi:hypothetical protein
MEKQKEFLQMMKADHNKYFEKIGKFMHEEKKEETKKGDPLEIYQDLVKSLKK